MGGYWDPASTIAEPYSRHGVKVFDFRGDHLTEVLIPAADLRDILVAKGYTVSRIESEGGFVTSDGRIFTVCMIRSGQSSSSGLTGRIILEWFASSEDAEDIASVAVATVSSSPFKNGRLSDTFNPATGVVFTGLADVLDYMAATDETFVQFAS